MYIRKEYFGPSFKIWATISTGLVAGGALYISLVEAPSRIKHQPSIAAEVFHTSTPKARKIIGSLNAAAIFCSIGAYFCTPRRSDSAVEWLLAGSMLIVTMPISKYFLAPINEDLMDVDRCNKRGENRIVNRLGDWNKCHGVRTMFNLVAFSYMVYLLAQRK